MFVRGVRLFRLFGINIRADWSWFIIAWLLAWSLAIGIFPSYYHGLTEATYWWMGIAGAIGLFICIVLHELGHALIARQFGVPVRSITLFIFGGVAEMDGEPPSPKAEFFTAIGGPVVTAILAGLLFGFAAWSVTGAWPVSVNGVFAYLAWINLILLAFNLIPAFPLDGGRVLRSALWEWRRDLRWATHITSNLGKLFGILLAAYGIFVFLLGNFVGGMWYFLIGLFIRRASQMSYEQVLLRELLAGESVRHLMTSEPVTVSPSDSIRNIVENYLYRSPHGLYPVVKDGRLFGCVTVDKLKQVPKNEWDWRTAETITEPCSEKNVIEPEANAVTALSTMSRNHSNRLMVVDHGQLLGVLAFKDLMSFFTRKLEFEGA